MTGPKQTEPTNASEGYKSTNNTDPLGIGGYSSFEDYKKQVLENCGQPILEGIASMEGAGGNKGLGCKSVISGPEAEKALSGITNIEAREDSKIYVTEPFADIRPSEEIPEGAAVRALVVTGLAEGKTVVLFEDVFKDGEGKLADEVNLDSSISNIIRNGIEIDKNGDIELVRLEPDGTMSDSKKLVRERDGETEEDSLLAETDDREHDEAVDYTYKFAKELAKAMSREAGPEDSERMRRRVAPKLASKAELEQAARDRYFTWQEE